VIDILYQDDHFVAVNKRSGLVVHPTKLAPDAIAVLPSLRKQMGCYVYPVHRIDRGTSGIVLFGLDSEVASRIGELMRSREVEKTYLALLRGYAEYEGRIDYAIEDTARENGRQESVTDYWRLSQVEIPYEVGPYQTSRYSLVMAKPLTGRRHQIRKHFAHLSHPVIGDTTYGDGDHNKLFRKAFRVSRLVLMASALEFEHPYTGEPVKVTCPIPKSIRDLFERFGWFDVPLSLEGRKAFTAEKAEPAEG
jgi:tRNA pseudouridine65 synthase